mmetsp:Transcript_2818/g.6738  ORF Transcript_2818/g.6738 Transcript_2818/m.6738 type:complete len:210 (-) Transcript_2818:602-1231(-)
MFPRRHPFRSFHRLASHWRKRFHRDGKPLPYHLVFGNQPQTDTGSISALPVESLQRSLQTVKRGASSYPVDFSSLYDVVDSHCCKHFLRRQAPVSLRDHQHHPRIGCHVENCDALFQTGLPVDFTDLCCTGIIQSEELSDLGQISHLPLCVFLGPQLEGVLWLLKGMHGLYLPTLNPELFFAHPQLLSCFIVDEGDNRRDFFRGDQVWA